MIGGVRAGLTAALALGLLAGCAGGPSPDAAAEETGETGAETSDLRTSEDGGEEDGAPDATARRAMGAGVGVSRARIVEAFAAEDLSADAFSPITAGNGREVVAASFPPTASRQVMWVGIFGDADAPYTVHIDYFPNRAQGGEAVALGAAVSRLLRTLFPDWPQAPDWPELAGQRAWQETAKLAQDAEEGTPTRIPVLEMERDGVWLEALGVGPRMVSYVITDREACRPSRIDDYFEGYASCR